MRKLSPIGRAFDRIAGRTRRVGSRGRGARAPGPTRTIGAIVHLHHLIESIVGFTFVPVDRNSDPIKVVGLQQSPRRPGHRAILGKKTAYLGRMLLTQAW